MRAGYSVNDQPLAKPKASIPKSQQSFANPYKHEPGKKIQNEKPAAEKPAVASQEQKQSSGSGSGGMTTGQAFATGVAAGAAFYVGREAGKVAIDMYEQNKGEQYEFSNAEGFQEYEEQERQQERAYQEEQEQIRAERILEQEAEVEQELLRSEAELSQLTIDKGPC